MLTLFLNIVDSVLVNDLTVLGLEFAFFEYSAHFIGGCYNRVAEKHPYLRRELEFAAHNVRDYCQSAGLVGMRIYNGC